MSFVFIRQPKADALAGSTGTYMVRPSESRRVGHTRMLDQHQVSATQYPILRTHRCFLVLASWQARASAGLPYLNLPRRRLVRLC